MKTNADNVYSNSNYNAKNDQREEQRGYKVNIAIQSSFVS